MRLAKVNSNTLPKRSRPPSPSNRRCSWVLILLRAACTADNSDASSREMWLHREPRKET